MRRVRVRDEEVKTMGRSKTRLAIHTVISSNIFRYLCHGHLGMNATWNYRNGRQRETNTQNQRAGCRLFGKSDFKLSPEPVNVALSLGTR